MLAMGDLIRRREKTRRKTSVRSGGGAERQDELFGLFIEAVVSVWWLVASV